MFCQEIFNNLYTVRCLNLVLYLRMRMILKHVKGRVILSLTQNNYNYTNL